ncbi:MAG: AAA family ATPase [Candidatus Binatia bacterium]
MGRALLSGRASGPARHQETLYDAVWSGAAVTDDTLTQSIGELRRALGDSARAPRFIETVHRLGFRFVAQPHPIDGAATAAARPSPRIEEAAETQSAVPDVDAAAAAAAPEPTAFVGRVEELKRLRALFAKARRGTRQIVLIGGETGIGKTSLVEQFLNGVRPQIDGAVLRGQCVQQYGAREPYMPVVEAIERHARGRAADALLPLMRRVAPHVYPLLTSLHAAESAGSPAAAAPPSYDCLLRELATLLESLAADSWVVLVLEDLHWSDAATMDLLFLLAQRPDPANLLVVGTYRPAEAALQAHPVRDLRHSFRTKRHHTDLALGYLSAADVDAYLNVRFGLREPSVARAVHGRTDGNPLFVVTVVEQWLRQGDLRKVEDRWVASAPAEHAVPDDLREVIAQQLRNVAAAELPVLEAASVAGIRVDPKLLAGALGRDHEAVEAACDRLAQSHLFLQKVATPASPAAGAAYEFTHVLQQQVIYDQIPELRRRRLHRAIGTELESTRGDAAADRAPELSVHYERAGLLTRAVEHLARCVGRAQQRGAHRQAATYVEHALRLLDRLPAGADRQRRELELRLLLGVSLNITHGYVSPEVRVNYDRARALCEAAGDDRQLFEIVSAIWYVQLGQRVDDARRNLEVLARIADRLDAPELRGRVVLSRGRTEFWNGQFPAAVATLGEFLDEGRGEERRAGVVYGVTPTVAAFMQRGLALWFVGCPEQARAHMRAGIEFAGGQAGPFDVASSYCQAALLELISRNEPDAARYAEQCLAVCRDRDVGFFQSIAAFLAAASSGGAEPRRLAAMRTALDEHRARVGTFLSGVMQSSIAATYGRMRKWDDAIRCVEDGIESTRDRLERIAEAELWRLRGELLISKARSRQRSRARPAALLPDARQSFARALDIAAEQGARAWTLRTRMSLARHTGSGPERSEALAELARVYESFTEGFDTPDLIDAKALLGKAQHPNSVPIPSGRLTADRRAADHAAPASRAPFAQRGRVGTTRGPCRARRATEGGER